ncbi:nuclear transport factor 2 family protein [Nocardioides sp. JQ2195]|uniref:nuclear transport factor 2 family protein n=1 Tax=Nocardioides sp. JQ2195 TaxID=2592334 RepID=UPI00143E90B2|nr:nuclear transport factor 2 family protein [Nocardioides sp. JQ2195]QIX27792.1 nuclear transport factor 2 family protein [Nocardioides sp. JQ2195]
MSTPTELGLARWHELVESKDTSGLRDMIAEDAVFHSPAVHAPQEGRDLVHLYLTGAINILGPELSYVDEWTREDDAILEFRTVVDGLDVSGIDRITWDDDGRITEFTVMIRPVKALHAVINRMGEELTRQAEEAGDSEED